MYCIIRVAVNQTKLYYPKTVIRGLITPPHPDPPQPPQPSPLENTNDITIALHTDSFDKKKDMYESYLICEINSMLQRKIQAFEQKKS